MQTCKRIICKTVLWLLKRNPSAEPLYWSRHFLPLNLSRRPARSYEMRCERSSSLNNEACPHDWADHFLILPRGLKYTHAHADLLWSSSPESFSQLFFAHPEWWKSAFDFARSGSSQYKRVHWHRSASITRHLIGRTPPVWTVKCIVALKRHSIVVHSQRAQRVLRYLMGLKPRTPR